MLEFKNETGYITIEKELNKSGFIGSMGIQIAKDGRVWICVDGEAVLRFKPLIKDE